MSRKLSKCFFAAVLLLFATTAAHLFFSSSSSPFSEDRRQFIFQHDELAAAATTSYNYAILELPEDGDKHRPQQPPPFPSLDAVLLPDWEVLLLLNSNHTDASSNGRPLTCLFNNGATSPAAPSGILPWSRRPTFRCTLPGSVRRHRPFYTPRLIDSPPPPLPLHHHPDQRPSADPDYTQEMPRWNFLAYESISTLDDLVLLAKGVNNRQGSSHRPSELRCVFYTDSPDFPSAVRTAVTTSSQEVFRCLHPEASHLSGGGGGVKVSLEFTGEEGRRPIPSVAQYYPRPLPAQDNKSPICACTMVHNVAKFLPEWITHHSAIGVERFFFYDNDSDDNLSQVISNLSDEFNLSTYRWPWPKTQEAGFSHCATMHKDVCTWMMYLDIDEFAFSPNWANSSNPSPHVLSSLLPPDSDESIGQVMLNCHDFGPSGQKEHPKDGVTQGYTCRTKAEERHKSLVRLDAVDESLMNVVHHFKVKEGFVSRKLSSSEAVVNHYKYQAWPEFRTKFRRRVSAYVADWTQAVNPGSKDRTPGLGFEAIEPVGWKDKFCEVRDTRLRDLVRRWFGRIGLDGAMRMAWE